MNIELPLVLTLCYDAPTMEAIAVALDAAGLVAEARAVRQPAIDRAVFDAWIGSTDADGVLSAARRVKNPLERSLLLDQYRQLDGPVI